MELLVTEGFVEGKKAEIVLRVARVLRHNPHASATALDTIEKTGIRVMPFHDSERLLPGVYPMVEVEVLDTFTIDNKKVRTYGNIATPIPGKPVYRADQTAIQAIVGKVTHPVEIGWLIGTHAPFIFEADSLMRHAVILGGSGTGKSWLRGILMEKLKDLGVVQLNFDPMGEFVRTVDDLGGVNLEVGRDLKPRLDVLTPEEFRELIEDFVPTDFQRRIAVEAFVEYKRRSAASLQPLPPERILRFAEEAADNLRASEDTKTNTVERLRAFLSSLRIAGTGNPDLPQFLKEHKLVNIYFKDVETFQISFAVASILKEIETLKRQRQIPNLLISTDEAHLLIPRGKVSSVSRSVLKKLLRYGRHYGIAVMLTTQLPSSLDQEALSIPALRIIFALSPEQIKGITFLLGDLPENVLRNLPKLELGTCVITGAKDLIKHSVYVRVTSRRRSRHGAPTPSFFE